MTYICYCFTSCLFSLWHCSYGVILCCYQKKFSFSLKVSLSLPCSSFLVWDFTCLSLEMSIKLFFFPFLFSGYFCSVDACVDVLFLVAVNSHSLRFCMKSSSRCIDASTLSSMLAGPLSPLFLTHSLFTPSLGCKALCMVISFETNN